MSGFEQETLFDHIQIEVISNKYLIPRYSVLQSYIQYTKSKWTGKVTLKPVPSTQFAERQHTLQLSFTDKTNLFFTARILKSYNEND